MTSVQKETPGALLGRVAGTAGTLVFGPTGPAVLLGTFRSPSSTTGYSSSRPPPSR